MVEDGDRQVGPSGCVEMVPDVRCWLAGSVEDAFLADPAFEDDQSAAGGLHVHGGDRVLFLDDEGDVVAPSSGSGVGGDGTVVGDGFDLFDGFFVDPGSVSDECGGRVEEQVGVAGQAVGSFWWRRSRMVSARFPVAGFGFSGV